MANSTSTLTKSVRLDFEAFMEEEKGREFESVSDLLYGKGVTTQLTEKFTTIADPGFPEETAQGSNSPEADFDEGYTWTNSVTNYQLQTSLTSIMRAADQSGLAGIQKYAKALVRRARERREIAAMTEPFVKAFSGSTGATVYGDGVELIDPSQPIKHTGGTQTNTFVDAVQRPLDYDALILLEQAAFAYLDNKGRPIDVTGKWALMTTPYLSEEAKQLTGAMGEPDVMSNNLNYWKAGSLGYIENKYMQFEFANFFNWNGSATKTSGNFFDTMYFLVNMDLAKERLDFKTLIPLDVNTWENESSFTEYAAIQDTYSVGLKYGKDFIFGSMGDSSTLT